MRLAEPRLIFLSVRLSHIDGSLFPATRWARLCTSNRCVTRANKSLLQNTGQGNARRSHDERFHSCMGVCCLPSRNTWSRRHVCVFVFHHRMVGSYHRRRALFPDWFCSFSRDGYKSADPLQRTYEGLTVETEIRSADWSARFRAASGGHRLPSLPM